jgi:hypothetical protein
MSRNLFVRVLILGLLLLALSVPISLLLAQTTTLTIDNVEENEGNTPDTTLFTFTVTRNGDITAESRADFQTFDTTATIADNDYVAASGTVIFPANDANPQTIQITVNGDDIDEANELFEVRLSNPVNATFVDDVGQGIITNDDGVIPGKVNLNRTTVNVAEGGATGVVTFTLDRPPSSAVTIDLSGDSECSVVPTQIVLNAGNWDTGDKATISAIDDDDDEGDHSCTVTTSASSSSDPDFNNLPVANIRGNIADNDGSSAATATPIGGVPTSTPIIPTNTPAPTPTPPIPRTGSVSNEVGGLAARTGPYLGATLNGSADLGFEYPILARSHDEGGPYTWFLIELAEGVTGWVSGRYLNFIGLEELLPTQGSIFDGIDGAPDLGVFGTTLAITDIRRRPSGRAQILGQVPPDTRVSLIGRTRQNGGDYWYHIRHEGLVGWIPAYVIRGQTHIVPIR